ncbi:MULTISPECIES: hypothetical protein [Methanosarcina]|nr:MULTISPECIES: hypothetical protein [Methanosarcina]
MEKLIDTVEFHRGVLAVLWQYIYARGFLEFYKKFFSAALKRLPGTSGTEVYRWWKNNIEVKAG